MRYPFVSCLWLCLHSILLLSKHCMALHAEDAGQLDFLVSTPGHGTTRFAHIATKTVLITSDSSLSPSSFFQNDPIFIDDKSDSNNDRFVSAARKTSSSTSCRVAGRDLTTGRLLWRRHVCSKKLKQGRHVVAATGDQFYTMDQTGVVRGWSASQRGALIWDANILLLSSSSTNVTAAAAASAALQSAPRLWLLHQQDLIVAVLGPILSVLDTHTGRLLGTLNVEEVNSATASAHGRWKPPSSEEATLQWIHVVASSSPSSSAEDTKKTVLQLILGYLEPQQNQWMGRISHTAVLEAQVSPDSFVPSNAATPLSSASSSFLASSLLALGSSAGAVSLGPASTSKEMNWIPIVSTNPDEKPSRPLDLSQVWQALQWTSLQRWQSFQPQSNLLRLIGTRTDGVQSMALATWFNENEVAPTSSAASHKLLVPSDDDKDDAVVLALTHCTAFDNLVVGIQQLPPQQSSSPWRAWQVVSSKVTPIPIEGDVAPSANSSSMFSLLDGDSIQDLITIRCSSKSMGVLLSTTSGTTLVVTFKKSSNSIRSQIQWSAEEGLSSISTALMIDASHIVLDDDSGGNQKKDPPLLVSSLDLRSRLEVQYKSIKSLILSSPMEVLGANKSGRRRYRDQTFGFVKIAVLLSKKVHRVWGLGTTDPHRGEIVWTLPLPPQATWHTMVHGKASSSVGINGINGGTHNREILVLSNMVDSMQWHCIDGTTGGIHQQGAVSISSSPIVQIVPLLGAAAVSTSTTGGKGSSCRQMALLLHEDQSVTLVPDDKSDGRDGPSYGVAAVHEIESSTKHGLYAHAVNPNQQQAKMEAFRVHVTDSGSFQASLVGQTLFPGEDVVGLAYPIRDEIVQSPAMVLGDDSLLVKYLNPHLAVVVTIASNTTKPLLLPSKSAKSKRKPLGVTPPKDKQQPDEAATATSNLEAPNFFVNVVDTVSGRVLHRASHSNVARPQQPTIPMVINENWIIYAFVNEKTRRTELGVLSLYEGMIDRNGITAFSSPEQTLAFSSLDARESKPVVLSKSFALTKQVTALGVTVTRAGISTPHILIACGDDKIYTIDRRMIEPRRPAGELKEAEKLEGLQQYRELLPLLSLQALNHNQTVEGITSIISAPTELESQSLILAFGGPDIFFSRTSPSRGFDLLPDSFNRILLSLVVLALLVALVVLRSMAYTKIVKESWI